MGKTKGKNCNAKSAPASASFRGRPPCCAIIRPLDEDVRADGIDQGQRRRVIEEREVINGLKAGQDQSSCILRMNRATMALQRLNGGIRVKSDHKQIGLGPGLLQILNMAGVEDVEAAVGKSNALAEAAAALQLMAEGFALENFLSAARAAPQ